LSSDDQRQHLDAISQRQRKARFRAESWPRRIIRGSIPVIGQEFALYAGIIGAVITVAVLWLLVGMPSKLATMIGLGAGIAVGFGWSFLFGWFEAKI
jgi:hypothetical protein